MVKKHDIKNLIIILLFCLFSFGKTQTVDWLEYSVSKNVVEKKESNAPLKKVYGLEFKDDMSKLQFYMKVQVTSEDESPAPRLCFSSTDQSCSPREQLVKNPNDKVAVMWLKREEFNKDDQELYVGVQTAKEGCSYTIRFEGAPQPSFPANFVYSYVINANNKEMRFDVDGTETDAYLTISLDGSSKAVLNVDNTYRDGVNYKSGRTFTFPLGGAGLRATNLASITVKCTEVGEYLTLSAHIVNTTRPYEGLAANGVLLPNGPEITGYLEEGVLNEECFPLDLSNSKFKSMNKLYVTARVHTKYAWFFLEDENRNYLEETDVEIFNGQLGFVMKNNGKMNYVCFELPSESTFRLNKMAFTVSLTGSSEVPSIYDYYPPQLVGDIYRRIIPKNSVAFFSGTKNDNTAKKYDYSLYQIKGSTRMYISDCRNYPDCHFSQSELSNLVEVQPTNQMSVWTTTDDKSSALNSEKYIIVAYCEDDDNENNGYCEFETSIFNKGQDIYLVEDEKFSKFVVKEEKGKFVADLQNGRQIQRLTFDIMIFSGDVTFNCYNSNNHLLTDEEIQISYEKYYLSNKVYFHINLAQLSTEQIIVEYKAELNSFFTIKYNVHSYNIEQLEESVPSGESYLVQINPNTQTKTKTVTLSNRFYKNNVLFLANFFELNCEFEVKRGEEEVGIFDGYGQQVLSSSSEEYKSDSYEYTIKIKEADLSNYNHKMCMLYVAGYEDNSNRAIVVGENINQQIVFEDNLKKIRFLYPHADATKDLAVHVNVIDKAFYKITFYANNQELRNTTVTRSQIIYLKGSVILNKCDENTLCPIVVQVDYEKEIIKTNPMIEITIREIKNTPTYLQKGQAKLDFVCGDRFYYLYTDVGKNEVGEVTINFLREFGNLWGRIVRKDQSFVDEEANWRGKYRMPSEDWEDSLPLDKYTKKLLISSEDTSDCIEGCYLLLSVQISQIGDYVEDYKFYPFSIITKITPNNKAYTDIPKVVIQVDEFVIGAVEIASNERIYEFYEVWLPHDSEVVEFDWQSSVAGLYINLGGTRPTTKNAHFKLTPKGKDTILKLNKEDILNKAKSLDIKVPDKNSLQDINLVIGIWTDKTDSINNELYSLRVHQPESEADSLEIIEVNTDQKIMCTPTVLSSSSNEYRCLFVVTYDDEDVNMFTPLLAYAGSTNNGALTYIFANYIERDIYDQFIKRELSANIPTYQTCEEFNTKKDGSEYIYTTYLKKGKYMFINVMTDKPEPIMIVTNMPVYNYISYDLFEFYPNPTTEQLLSVPGEQLRLSFPGSDSVMVNIVTLNGHAEVSWKSEPDRKFVLRGVADRLSLSSGDKNDQLVIRKLGSTSVSNTDNLKMEDAGFAFYISYHKMSLDNHMAFEEINYGQSTEMAFKDADLPLVLYNKIGLQYRDINVAITFKDNEIEQKGSHSYNPLLITAILVKEKTIYDCKKDRDVTPPLERSVIGNYDTALKTAQIFLSEDKIKTYNLKDEDNPTIYVRIEKMMEYEEKTFNKFSVEAQISGVNDGVIPVEKVYHYGRVRNTRWGANFYRLRVDKNKKYMKIQIAFNSNNLNYVISDRGDLLGTYSNITFHRVETARGKGCITIKVDQEKNFYYLYIFKRERTVSEEFLNNYAFKYINGKEESDFYDYPILESPEINIEESKEGDEDVIKCTFNKLEVEDGKANVTYFFKVVENLTHIYGEEINTVAVTESPYYSVYERNPAGNNGKVTLTARGKLSNWVYLNVIAQIQQNNVLEYVAYNGKKHVRPYSGGDSKDKSQSDNTAMFVVVGIILIAIVIGLIVTIFIFQQKNKNLLNQVKHVSFQQTNTNPNNNVDPNLLLQKSQQGQ